MRHAETVFSTAAWRKSSYSGTQGNCVEVAPSPSVVGVRDTKNRDGGVLYVTVDAWRELTARL